MTAPTYTSAEVDYFLERTSLAGKILCFALSESFKTKTAFNFPDFVKFIFKDTSLENNVDKHIEYLYGCAVSMAASNLVEITYKKDILTVLAVNNYLQEKSENAVSGFESTLPEIVKVRDTALSRVAEYFK